MTRHHIQLRKNAFNVPAGSAALRVLRIRIQVVTIEYVVPFYVSLFQEN